MVIEELVTYLEGQALGTRAVNIFAELMPPDDDPSGGAIVVLYEYGGLPSEPDLGTGNMRLVFPLIQVVCRGIANDRETPRLKAQAIVTAFTRVVNQNLSGISYKAIEARQDPFRLRIDENHRWEFVVNFKVTKGYSAT